MISKKAKLIEKALRSIDVRRSISKMMLNPARKNKYESPPGSFYKKYNVKSFIVNNKKCFSIKSVDHPQKHVFYFHGGAYTLQALKTHWSMLGCILEKTQCEITFVNYPLTPENNYIETTAMVSEAYSYASKDSRQEIILMGDSAGGGLALALAQHIAAEKIQPIPAKIIMLSPWLDISMSSEISKELAGNDLTLNKETLKAVGKKYAQNLDSKNYLCSPLYGSLNDLGNIALFTGTSEILNVQARQLRDKLVEQDKQLSYYEYEGMQHVWLVLPIPEAKDAMEKVIAFIEK